MINRGHQSFPFGIEEEYFLVSSRTRALVDEPPRQLLDECKAMLGDRVSAEYQRSQLEVATSVCANLFDARAELAQCRNVIASMPTAMDWRQSPLRRIPSHRGVPSATPTRTATT